MSCGRRGTLAAAASAASPVLQRYPLPRAHRPPACLWTESAHAEVTQTGLSRKTTSTMEWGAGIDLLSERIWGPQSDLGFSYKAKHRSLSTQNTAALTKVCVSFCLSLYLCVCGLLANDHHISIQNLIACLRSILKEIQHQHTSAKSSKFKVRMEESSTRKTQETLNPVKNKIQSLFVFSPLPFNWEKLSQRAALHNKTHTLFHSLLPFIYNCKSRKTEKHQHLQGSRTFLQSQSGSKFLSVKLHLIDVYRPWVRSPAASQKCETHNKDLQC